MATTNGDPSSNEPIDFDESPAIDPETGVPDQYALQDPKTCQPECDCRCHWVAGAPACCECGGPGAAIVVDGGDTP